MSRSGYVEDIEENWRFIMYRGAVTSAIKGKRGQRFLRELIAALDAMPERVLIGDSLVTSDGEYCALGVLGAARGIDLEELDPEDCGRVAETFGIAEAMAREIVWENDESFDPYEWVDFEICGPIQCHWRQEHVISQRVLKKDVNHKRWMHMRKWAKENLIKLTEDQKQEAKNK